MKNFLTHIQKTFFHKKQETENTIEHWALFPAGGVKVTAQDAKVHFQVHRSICRCESLQPCVTHFMFNDVLFEMLFEIK